VQPRLGAIIDQVVTLVTTAMPCISYGMLAWRAGAGAVIDAPHAGM
jgi:hypothetical protein